VINITTRFHNLIRIYLSFTPIEVRLTELQI